MKKYKKNDKYKEEMALKNGIKNYVVIDARKSSVMYIIDSIKSSSLCFLLDSIDIARTLKKCLLQSKVIDLVELYNLGITSPQQLSKYIGVSRNVCSNYIELAKTAKLIA